MSTLDSDIEFMNPILAQGQCQTSSYSSMCHGGSHSSTTEIQVFLLVAPEKSWFGHSLLHASQSHLEKYLAFSVVPFSLLTHPKSIDQLKTRFVVFTEAFYLTPSPRLTQTIKLHSPELSHQCKFIQNLNGMKIGKGYLTADCED